MKNFKILIVDQRQKSREGLRTQILALGSQFSAAAVPSGEEALLEIRTQSFDVLVSQIRLPGMDGVELMEKARKRCPTLKIILLNQGADKEIKIESEGEGPDAVFNSLGDTAGLLVAIERCLNFEGVSQSLPLEEPVRKDGRNVENSLSDLHSSLSPMSSVLLDHDGRILAQIGEVVNPEIFPLILSAYHANHRLERYLGSRLPGDTHFFPGVGYDIFLASVEKNYLLVVFVELGKSEYNLGEFIELISQGVQEMEKNDCIPLDPGDKIISEDQIDDFEKMDLVGEEPLLDAILRKMDENVPGKDDVDAFWDSISQGELESLPQDRDILTYDQAAELGLGLNEGEE